MKNEPNIRADLASTDELRAALAQLSAADAVRLRQIARLRSAGTAWTWEDLLQEAITRGLEGTRRWPKCVALAAFLAQTMRSIAYDERHAGEVEVSESDLSTADEAIVLRASSQNTPDKQLGVKQALTQVQTLFEGDEVAFSVLVSMAENQSPEAIRAELGLTPTQYATVQRRIRRKLVAFKGLEP